MVKRSAEATEARQKLWCEIGAELPGGEGEAGWAQVMATLEDYPLGEPPAGAAEETARWVAGLPLPGAFRRRMLAEAPGRPRGFWPVLAIIRSQMGVFSRGFWLAAAAAMGVAAVAVLGLIGLAATAPLEPAVRLSLPLAIASPLVAALGASYALRSFGRGPWEVELSCPITPVSMALGRLVIVLAYVIGLSLVVTLALGAGHVPEGAPRLLWLVVLSWLAPVLFLGAFSLYVSLWVSPLAGAVASLAVWSGAALVERWRPGLSFVTFPGQPTQVVLSVAMVLLAVGLCLGAARLAGTVADRAGGMDG